MASYKVTYFDARGGGEIIRLTLVAAGQKFEDERLTSEAWQARKPDAPMKALPLLTIKDGGDETVFCQSGTCAKSLARRYGLGGTNPKEETAVDEVYESVMDTQREMYKPFFAKEEEKDGLWEKFTTEQVPKFANYFDGRIAKFGKDGYLVGGKLTLADIVVFNFVDAAGRVRPGLWDKFPALTKHRDLVLKNEKIAEWVKNRPETKF